MQTINILLSSSMSKNEYAFIFPLGVNQGKLQGLGLRINFVSGLSAKVFDCNVLIVSSHFARQNDWWSESKKDFMFKFFENAKTRIDHLVWADMGDSTGATHFEVLKYVCKYLKGALLKNRKLYLNFHYGSRYFTDYYHRNYQIEDTDPGEPHLNFIPAEGDLQKVQLSWNQAFINYSYLGFYYDRVKRKVNSLPYANIGSFSPPEGKKSSLLQCRINTNYHRNTVAFQRKRIREKLHNRIPTNRINRRKFFTEMKHSRVVLSPFGWGEICYRDFEAIVAGAALLKPNVSHMETWPDLYIENKTCICFDWDLETLEETVSDLASKNGELVEIAQEAQRLYDHYLHQAKGQEEFCERFENLMRF